MGIRTSSGRRITIPAFGGLKMMALVFLEAGRSPVGRPLLPADCRGHRGRGWMQPVRRCILLTATSSVPAARISSRPSPILAAWADRTCTIHWHGAGICPPRGAQHKMCGPQQRPGGPNGPTAGGGSHDAETASRRLTPRANCEKMTARRTHGTMLS